MQMNGTLINYFFHCKRQCYLFGNRLNLEDNSEIVKIGKALHEERADGDNTELKIENVRLDKLTKEYLIELKKSDADVEAAKWQVLFYLKILKDKGIQRKGRIEFQEKNRSDKKTVVVELTEENEEKLKDIEIQIEQLLNDEKVPEPIYKRQCKRCAYYEYCYI